MTTFGTSTIPAFRAALIAALQARTGLAGVPICDGRPTPGVEASYEYVALTQTRGAHSVRALDTTTQPRNEEYQQDVLIKVAATTQDQVPLGNRCFAILAELEQAIRADPRLTATFTGPAGSVLYAIVMGPIDYQVAADDTARESWITATLNVTARL